MSGKIYIGLGANLGDREKNLSDALNLLQISGLEVISASNLHETMPWGLTDQPAFLNQVILAHWAENAFSLLDLLLSTEQKLGRIRSQKWGPRIIDLDLLDFRGEIILAEGLQLPHPHIAEREFVLAPWAEIAPHHRLPGSELTISEMLKELQG
jgi:2-amino-4-hydroxy-6-hydroxymethyldihydropteridine diphosphokinase